MLIVNVTSIEHIHYVLVDRYGVTVNQYNESVYYDGNIFLFELPPPAVYFSISDYIACTGEIFHIESSVTIVQMGENLNISDFKSNFKTQGNSDSFGYLIFPNPTNCLININFSCFKDDLVNIELRKMNGKNLMVEQSLNTGKTTLNLSELPKGIYLLTIKTSNKVFNEKIVLQ